MSLTPETIAKNTRKYFKTANEKGFMNDELMAFLGESFIKAPASTQTDYHNAFEGGLIAHLLLVTSYAVRINDALPEEKRVDKDSLLKVCLLHQIGKAHLYVPNPSEWHRNNLGKMYDFNEELTSMRSGERSIYYALSYGVKLTEVEASAIIMFDKFDDKQSDFHNSRLGKLLKAASEMAILEEQGK